MKKRLFLIFIPILFCGMGIMEHGEEISTLKDQAAAEAVKGKLSAEQEKAFENVSRAAGRKELHAGLTRKNILDRYGKPSMSDSSNGEERWLYRSSKGKMLERPWIFLYFDSRGNLSRWDCGHMDCGRN